MTTIHTHPEVNHILKRIAELDHLELSTYHHTEHKPQDIENEIDPENNFFLNINNDCHYYMDDQYNSTLKTESKMSIIHFNSRCLYANFHNIKDYLTQFTQPFNITVISETWINSTRDMDFELEGYELNCMNRNNPRPTTLYVKPFKSYGREKYSRGRC